MPFSLSNPIVDASHGWRRLVAHQGNDGKPMLPSGSVFQITKGSPGSELWDASLIHVIEPGYSVTPALGVSPTVSLRQIN